MTGRVLEGSNWLFLALKDAYGLRVVPAERTPDGKPVNRAASPCPVCVARGEQATWLTVALDNGNESASCYRGCSEEAIWRALGSRPAQPERHQEEKHARDDARSRTHSHAHNRTLGKGDPHRDVLLSEDISKGVISEDISKGADDRQREASKNQARVRVLGIAAEPGIEFRCVLPGHEHSAKLIAAPEGYWLYECAGRPPISLGELRAAHESGQVRWLSKTLASRWLERLDYDAGLVTPRPVITALPDGLSDATRKVANGIALFLGLRDERWVAEPFTFARDFVVAYCGVTPEAARHAMERLEKARVISRVDDEARTLREPIKWRLTEQDRVEASLACHAALLGAT